MDPLDVQPWLEDCLTAIDVRPGERVLQIGSHPGQLTAALCAGAGRDGRIVVLERDRAEAELGSDGAPEGVEIVCADYDAAPAIGRHDRVVGMLEDTEHTPPTVCAEVVRHNLRPGGRFVLDFPSDRPCDILTSIWSRCGGDEAALAAWSGPEETAMAEALRAAGMRSVACSASTHLLRSDSPHGLAVWLMARLQETDPDVHESIAILLAERFRGSGPCEVPVHRTRFSGIY